MSLNACEAYLLELRKDEIWQLLYVQRRSEGEAYETLVRKGLGWLGEQRFRQTITRWEREESEVWPARPGYWRPHGCTDDHSNCVHKPCQECVRLDDDASGRLSNFSEERQSNHQGTISHSPHAQDHGPKTPRNPPPYGTILLQEATHVSEKGSDTNAEPYSGLPLNAQSQFGGDTSQTQSLVKGLTAYNERMENPVGKWLLNTPLSMNPSSVAEWKSPPSVSNLSSQTNYTSSVPEFCADCSENHSSLSTFLYDPSSSYTERGSAVQPARKPVSHIFGYIISPADDEEDSESEIEDEREDDGGLPEYNIS